eukprot:m.20053 g.20053  ORF g.20053 m.20053 type:complete len:415 (+) comp6737_c0_seq2:336-1580(+)
MRIPQMEEEEPPPYTGPCETLEQDFVVLDSKDDVEVITKETAAHDAIGFERPVVIPPANPSKHNKMPLKVQREYHEETCNDSSTAASNTKSYEIPLQVACAAKDCGYYGTADKEYLCSIHYEQAKNSSSTIPDEDVMAMLLERCGFQSLADARIKLLVESKFGKREPPMNTKVAGVTSWKTTTHPYTQFDEIPLRGDSACTFIAAVAAIFNVVWEKESKIHEPVGWRTAICQGVNAFTSMKDGTAEGEILHRSLDEALPYVWDHIGRSIKKAERDELKFKEKVVGLCKPDHLAAEDYLQFLGPADVASKTFGRDGIIKEFQNVLKGERRTSIVVTRPPETYVILKNDNGRISFRDSHRQTQYNFESLEALLAWVAIEQSYFCPMPSQPEITNQVALHILSESVASGLLEAKQNF